MFEEGGIQKKKLSWRHSKLEFEVRSAGPCGCE
jgi:hypothetical protein